MCPYLTLISDSYTLTLAKFRIALSGVQEYNICVPVCPSGAKDKKFVQDRTGQISITTNDYKLMPSMRMNFYDTKDVIFSISKY